MERVTWTVRGVSIEIVLVVRVFLRVMLGSLLLMVVKLRFVMFVVVLVFNFGARAICF